MATLTTTAADSSVSSFLGGGIADGTLPTSCAEEARFTYDAQDGGFNFPNKGEFLMEKSNAYGHAFRSYEDTGSSRQKGVEDFYRTNHIFQTYDFVNQMHAKHLKLDKTVMGIWDACELLNEYVDESDPDLDLEQIEHLLQTAEAIRKDHPNDEWFHLTGLIHDLGKVLLHPKFGAEPQWAVVGDTFPVGCKFDSRIVHSKYFAENPDDGDPRYNSQCGVYEAGCGLDKLKMSWGHDEYMYHVMVMNGTTLPPEALYITRYHSFYALHKEGAYKEFMNDFDREMFPWIKEFNKYDLYSKSTEKVDVEELKPYYQSLIAKYFPQRELKW
eukprot:TRINITY_DN6887_c0_g2_i1.p1 TRINITY_DN6887_c0_g2~~TRINITY_DN6887_c0_g2_i1.p1  ORF type:complete len:328 (-),score=64.93 TRINITY_DN6887_c0_g2_i1:646-1629(-)